MQLIHHHLHSPSRLESFCISANTVQWSIQGRRSWAGLSNGQTGQLPRATRLRWWPFLFLVFFTWFWAENWTSKTCDLVFALLLILGENCRLRFYLPRTPRSLNPPLRQGACGERCHEVLDLQLDDKLLIIQHIRRENLTAKRDRSRNICANRRQNLLIWYNLKYIVTEIYFRTYIPI